MLSKPLLELAGVALRVNSGLAFRNTCWTFARDQNWALVGRNGSGKTLLARALAGEVPVAEGEIRYNFRPPRGRVPEDCVLLVSFEQQKAIPGDAPAAARWFSGEQDEAISVGEFLSQDSVEEINPFEVRARREQTPRAFKRRRQSILNLLQIGPLLNQSLPSLSTGEMRKVLLARVLLRRPRLLILDDVFAGLDGQYRLHLKKILERLMRRKAVRVLLVNPRPDELPRGVTHIMCVEKCKVVVQGPRTAVMRHPLAKDLFGAPALPGPRGRFHSGNLKTNRGAEELVRLENARVRYDGREILSGIDWIVRRGESWAVVGPNGSGKSTLLSLISGDNPQAYANRIFLFGCRRGTGESVWEIKKRIGCISSELHLHFPDAQTCLETVISGFHESSGCCRRASSEQRAAALRMLRHFGLARSAKDSFGSLSPGSQRMVLLF